MATVSSLEYYHEREELIQLVILKDYNVPLYAL